MKVSLPQLLDTAGSLIGDTLSGLTVSVKTNLGPEVTVYPSGPQGSGEGAGATAGALSALGFKAAVIVRDKNGAPVQIYGDYPATSPVAIALVLAVLAILAAIFVKGVFPR